jgi:hypothetical protein
VGTFIASCTATADQAATSFGTDSQLLSRRYKGLAGATCPAGGVVIKVNLLSCTLVSLLLCSFLSWQTGQRRRSRPESFEWDHQIALYDEAFDNHNYAEAEKFGRRSLEIVE